MRKRTRERATLRQQQAQHSSISSSSNNTTTAAAAEGSDAHQQRCLSPIAEDHCSIPEVAKAACLAAIWAFNPSVARWRALGVIRATYTLLSTSSGHQLVLLSSLAPFFKTDAGERERVTPLMMMMTTTTSHDERNKNIVKSNMCC